MDQDPSLSWLIQDFILSDAAIQISGPATLGYKTWLAFQIAMCVASGKSVSLLKPFKPEPVLVIEVEGPRKPTRNRFTMLENASGIHVKDLDNFWFSHRDRLCIDDRSDIENVAQFVKLNGVKLVVIDTLAKVCRGDENSVKDVSNAMRGLDLVRENGAAILYLHHTGKPSGERTDIDDQTRGSSALSGFYDAHLAIRRQTDAQKHLDLTVRSNEAEEAWYQILWMIDKEHNAAHLQMEKLDAKDALSEAQRDLCLLRLMPYELYTLTALKAAWGMHSNQQTKDLANTLIDENVLELRGKKYRLV